MGMLADVTSGAALPPPPQALQSAATAAMAKDLIGASMAGSWGPREFTQSRSGSSFPYKKVDVPGSGVSPSCGKARRA